MISLCVGPLWQRIIINILLLYSLRRYSLIIPVNSLSRRKARFEIVIYFGSKQWKERYSRLMYITITLIIKFNCTPVRAPRRSNLFLSDIPAKSSLSGLSPFAEFRAAAKETKRNVGQLARDVQVSCRDKQPDWTDPLWIVELWRSNEPLISTFLLTPLYDVVSCRTSGEYWKGSWHVTQYKRVLFTTL